MSTSAKLGNLVQRKGDAKRPMEMPQRGEPVADPAPASAPPPEPEPKTTKALTLKFSEAEYEELRVFCFSRRRSHQSIMHEAVISFMRNNK